MCPSRQSTRVTEKMRQTSWKQTIAWVIKKIWVKKRERGGEGASVKAWEQKRGAEDRHLCLMPLFIPAHSKLNKSCFITPSVVMCFPASSSCSPPQITTSVFTHTLIQRCVVIVTEQSCQHPKEGCFVRHHAWPAMWKCLASRGFLLNLLTLHLPWFGNTITRSTHSQGFMMGTFALPGAHKGHNSQEEHPVNECFPCCFQLTASPGLQWSKAGSLQLHAFHACTTRNNEGKT